MTAGDWVQSLLERTTELVAIDEVLARARGGIGSVLVIEGAAGEGKSALLAAALERAAGVTLTTVDDAHRLGGTELRAVAQDLSSSDHVALVAFRPDEPGADKAALDDLRTGFGARVLRLGPLGPASVATLVRRRRPEATDELCREVFDATAGNPLYVEELLSGDPRRPFLMAVCDRVMRRLAPLGEDGPALARAIAVLGGGRLDVAAGVADVSPERARALAHQLRRMDVLVSEDPTAFTQPLVERSIYHGMPDHARHAAHAGAAVALREARHPPNVIARHLAALPPDGSDETVAALLGAAEAAGSGSEAIYWLRRAVRERAANPPRAELLQRLGELELAERDSAAIGHLREALELTEDSRARVAMGLTLAEVLGTAGQWDSAVAVMRSIEPDLGPEDDELSVHLTSVLTVITAHDAARVGWFDRERARLTELSQGGSWSAHALRAVLSSAAAQRDEDPTQALRLAEASLADGILLAEQGAGGWAAPHAVLPFILTDHLERGLEVCDTIEAASKQAGAVAGVLLAADYRGWILSRAGDLTQAEAWFRRAFDLLPDPPLQLIVVDLASAATEVLLERPGLSDLATLVETIEPEPGFRNTWSGAMLHWTRGRLRLARRDRDRGIRDLEEVGRIARALGTGVSMSPWRSALALALPTERHQEALVLAEEELGLARASGLPRSVGVALRTLGALTPGEAGVSLLRESLAVLEGSAAKLEHARSLIELGAALRRARRSREARVPLGAGLELATACGAIRLSARARAELASAAGRPSRQVADDRLLTPSELRVARLAVAGASNPEIARQLFVSLKTVEHHLSHAYAKLGLAGRGARRELAAALVVYQPG
jgi:DNA-binding CsgD family transcriptional regulator